MTTSSKQQTSVQVSMLSGKNFYFLDKEAATEIRVKLGSFSGDEAVYLDSKEVSNKHSRGRVSKHTFTHNDNQYEVEINVTNILLESVSCTLIKNEVHYETLKYSLWSHKNNLIKTFLASFAIGTIAGYTIVAYFLDKA